MTDLMHDLPVSGRLPISSLDVKANIPRITLESQGNAAIVCSSYGHYCSPIYNQNIAVSFRSKKKPFTKKGLKGICPRRQSLATSTVKSYMDVAIQARC